MENTGPLPDGWWREEPLEKKIGKKILHPGSRGGHGYWDEHGKWQYGEHPTVHIPKITLKESSERAMTAEDHVMDILHDDLGITDSDAWNRLKPIERVSIFRDAVASYMEKRAYNKEESDTAYAKVRKRLENMSKYNPVLWNQDTLDARLKDWMGKHGVPATHYGDALVAMSKEKREQVAQDIAGDLPTFSWDVENGAAQQAKMRKEALERIMEIRYGIQYELSPEDPAPTQHMLELTDNEWRDSSMPRARAVHEAISATDRFEDIPHHLLPLALAMDPEVAPLLANLGSKGRKILEPFYQHNVNLLAAQNLAAMATSDQFGAPIEMKMLWDMLKVKGDLSEDGGILTAQDVKEYLEDTYQYKPLSADLRHAKSAWEGVSMALERAGLTNLAEAINGAWKKASTAPQSVGQFPMTADIEPGDQDDGDQLFNEFNQEISELDYQGGGASDDDISEMEDQYFPDHYQEAVSDLARDYKRENRDEYDTILMRLAEAYVAENLDLDEYLEKNDGDEDLAKAQMLVDAQEAVEDDAEEEFDEHAREMVDDEATENAQESAHDAAVEYYNEYGNGSGDMEDNAKAKVDIMNTLGSIMENQHGVTVDACRKFFRTISEEPNDEFTQNRSDHLHEYIAGAAAHLVQSWASSSDGHNAVSNAMQILVSDLFPDVPRWDERPEHMDESAFDQGQEYVGDPHFRAVAEPFLRSMYEHTQQRFKEAGVEHVVISRGIKDGHGDQIQDAINAGIVAFGDDSANQGQGGFITGTHPIIDNPMSSWSWSPSTSEGFASRSSVVFAAKVPVERVIGTFRTGYGCMEEEEAVVLGGGGLARWYYQHGSGSGSSDNRPKVVGRALSGEPLKIEPVMVSDYNDYKLKGIYKPGRMYDANQGEMVRGVLPDHLVSHNKAAEEYNAKYAQKKVDAAIKAEEIMEGAGVDLSTHPGMKTYLSNVLHQVTDDNHAYNEQTKQSLTGHGATKEQAEKLYDKIVSLTKNDTTPETQLHHIAMHASISAEKAKEVYEYLKPFKNAPPSAQNHEGYAKQHIEGLIKQFGMGGYAATNIINHIQATPGMFKDNDYTPSLGTKVPKIPKIPKTDNSGQVVPTMHPQVKTIASHLGITTTKAADVYHDLKSFIKSDLEQQTNHYVSDSLIHGLKHEHGLSESQAKDILNHIINNPELYTSATKTPVPMIPKTDSSGPSVESKVKLFMSSGGMSKKSAEAAHQALQTFMKSPPHIQNNKQQQQANIDDLVQYEGLTKYQATQIVSLIKDKPELFNGGQAVQKGTAPGSNPMSSHEAQVQFIATHTGVSQAAAKQSSEAMSDFKSAPLKSQQDKEYQFKYMHKLVNQYYFTNDQAVKLVKLYAEFPEVFKSHAVEGSSRLQKALAWTADLARRLGH